MSVRVDDLVNILHVRIDAWVRHECAYVDVERALDALIAAAREDERDRRASQHETDAYNAGRHDELQACAELCDFMAEELDDTIMKARTAAAAIARRIRARKP